MQDNINRRLFLSTVGAGISLLPLLALTSCRQEEKILPEKKLFTDPKLELMDLALQHEYGAIVQYSNHAGIISTLESNGDSSFKDRVKQIIADEVHHAILLSNILTRNDVTPTISVWPPQTAKKPVDMLQKDILAEKGAIDLYEQISTLDLNDYEKEVIDTIAHAELIHYHIFSELMEELA